MKNCVILIFCLLLSFLNASAQSVIENKPTAKGYSESVGYMPIEFPDDKAKNDKKPNAKPDKNKNNGASKQDNNITIPVTVVDKQGKFIEDLQNGDFDILIDDQKIDKFSLESKAQPLNIILLLDTSPSTVLKITELQNYALNFVETLNPQDKIMIVVFDVGFKVKTELTNDRNIITKAIKKTNFGNGTSLYEAIQKLFEKHIKPTEERTAVVLITDGVDTTSGTSDYPKSLAIAENYNIPFFVVNIDSFENNQKTQNNASNNILFRTIFRKNPQQTLESIKLQYEIGKSYLNDLIYLSGGRVSLFENKTDPQFAEELRFKYYLKFTPPETDKVGARKKIKVRVNRPDLVVFAKGSYIAN